MMTVLLWNAFSLPVLNTELRVRYTGLLLELLGVATVIAGLTDKSRLFDRPSLGSYIVSSVKEFPRWPGADVNVALTGVSLSASTGMVARLSAWSRAADDSLEKRVAALEKNIESLKADHSEAVQALRKADESLRNDLKREVAESRAAELDLRKKLEGLGADGLHIEALGVLWVVVGTILSTISSELAKLAP